MIKRFSEELNFIRIVSGQKLLGTHKEKINLKYLNWDEILQLCEKHKLIFDIKENLKFFNIEIPESYYHRGT